MAHLPEAVHRLLRSAARHGRDDAAAVVHEHRSDPSGRGRSGSIVGFLRGVYRSPSWPIDELSRCAAVCVGRPYAAIAGPTAGRIYGVPATATGLARARPDATGSEASRRKWVAAYRTAAIQDQDVAQRPDGLRITSTRPYRARSRPVRATGRPSVDHRAGDARRPPHGRGDDGSRGRLHLAAAAVAHHLPGSTRASGGRRAGRVGPGGTRRRSAPRRRDLRIGTPISDRSPWLRPGAVRSRRALTSLGDRGRRTSCPSRDRWHRERSPPRPRLPGGGLVDVAHFSGRLRAGLRRHHRRPPSRAPAPSLRAEATKRRGDVDVGRYCPYIAIARGPARSVM